jgi:cytochrome P450
MTIEEPVVDVFGEEFQRNPYGVLREARARARCARDPFGSLILLRADDFEAVASDGRFGAFGDRLARMLGLEAGPGYDWLAGSLMFLDPPDHTRLRGFARKEFTPRRVAALRNAILATTDHLLRDWSAQLLPDNPTQVPAADRAVTEFCDYVEALIRERRRSPSEDLVSALTAAASDGKLTPDELWILITLLVFAGNDTTMGLLANSVYLLVAHPDQLKLLKDQPETYIDTAIEEFLRFEPPVSGNGRIARQDVQLGDPDHRGRPRTSADAYRSESRPVEIRRTRRLRHPALTEQAYVLRMGASPMPRGDPGASRGSYCDP